jgi:hypothetical protein
MIDLRRLARRCVIGERGFRVSMGGKQNSVGVAWYTFSRSQLRRQIAYPSLPTITVDLARDTFVRRCEIGQIPLS